MQKYKGKIDSDTFDYYLFTFGNEAKNSWWNWWNYFLKYGCKSEGETGNAEEQPVSNRIYQVE